MQLKKITAAVVLGLGFAAFAQAATPLGELNYGSPLFGYGNPQGPGGHDYSFTDEFTFTVSPSILGGSAYQALPIVFSLDFGTGSGTYSLDELNVFVYTGIGSAMGTDPVFQGSATRSGPGTLSVHGSFVLDSPDYTLVVSGLTSGPSGGAPQGGLYAFTMNAAPVPEPSEYAMLLAGLGVVGMIARRRKMNVN